jgi:hypothetical protein
MLEFSRHRSVFLHRMLSSAIGEYFFLNATSQDLADMSGTTLFTIG